MKGGELLARLIAPPVNILSPFGSFKFAERMCMDPVLATLAFNQMTEVERCSWGGPDPYFAYDFETGTVCGYQNKRPVLVKRQKVHNYPALLLWSPTVDFNFRPNVARKLTFLIQRD